MKKTVSFLVASFLIASAHAGEKIVVANAAPTTQAKPVVVKVKTAKKAEKIAPVESSVDSSLEAFACCGLPSSYR